MKNKRPTYPDTNLCSKHFKTEQAMLDWANCEDGTDFIVSIVQNVVQGGFMLFYIEE